VAVEERVLEEERSYPGSPSISSGTSVAIFSAASTASALRPDHAGGERQEVVVVRVVAGRVDAHARALVLDVRLVGVHRVLVRRDGVRVPPTRM
jgi:hypothetical protein